MNNKVSRLAIFTLTACLLTAGSAFSEEVAQAAVSIPLVKGGGAKAGVKNAPEASQDGSAALLKTSKKEIEMMLMEDRRRAKEMSEPRNKQMAVVSEANEKTAARIQAILAENADAAKLDAEIRELQKTMDEKMTALNKILEGDKQLADLKKAVESSKEELSSRQRRLREEIARQHRERRMKQAAQTVAEPEKTTAEDSEGAASKKTEIEKAQ